MLNMNTYVDTGLFKHGVSIDLGAIALHRYANGELRGKFTFVSVLSAGTGHWPFTLFDLSFLTGELSAWQLTFCGLVVGSKVMHDLDEDGFMQGPDKRKHYFFTSCFNHQSKTMEDIINE